MDKLTFRLWMFAIAAVVASVAMFAWASVENSKTRAQATVLKAQEHTKRAEGRHELVDFLGLLKGR